MTDILKRLKGATGPDMELDFWISARAWDPSHHTDEELQADIDLVGIEGMVIDMPFTSSIDAALALVERMLPDALWTIGHRGDETPNLFMCVIMPSSGAPFHETHQTPAIAILTALFTALEAKG